MRKESLEKDRNDDGALRNGHMREEKELLHQEFLSNVPFFFNAWGSEIDLVGHYKGASAFLICNGPSLSSGKYDLSLLKRPGVFTMGINNGPRTIRPNIWTCVDDPKRFIKSIWLDPSIQKIVPMSFTTKALFDNENWCDMLDENGKPYLVRKCPNVTYVRRNEKFQADRYLVEDTINWGNSAKNGGSRSVMLAAVKILYLLGFRKVYLLGADFDMTGEKTYHFDEQREKGAVRGNMSTYDALKNIYFPSLRPYFEKAGYNVYNCNLDSQLKAFDFVKYEDAIEEATYKLGDIANERTWGLYSKPEERQKWKDQPPDKDKIHLKTIKNRPIVPVYNNVGEWVAPANNIPNIPKQAIIQQPVNMMPPKYLENNNPQIIGVNKDINLFRAPSIPKPLQVQFKPFNKVPERSNGQLQIKQVSQIENEQRPMLAEQGPIIPNRRGKIIKNLPCDSVIFGTSDNNKNNNNNNITLEDNGL